MLFVVIDCGTTTTRIYVVDSSTNEIIASDRRKIGVRDTSITGSKDILREGISEFFFEVLQNNKIEESMVSFAIASGMITSEIGLIEIPHITAPAGLKELSEGIVEITDNTVLPINKPVYFIKGIKNNIKSPIFEELNHMDFMRGEEVQCMGIINKYHIPIPANIIALSSHTKIMYINNKKQIETSYTTLSGQFREALLSSTSIGKSLQTLEGDRPCGASSEKIISIAFNCTNKYGLLRASMMPRFMHVLMHSDSKERELFLDAAIAAEDFKIIKAMKNAGYVSDYYFIYGHENRCIIFEYMLKAVLGQKVTVEYAYKHEELDSLTVDGVIAIADMIIKKGSRK